MKLDLSGKIILLLSVTIVFVLSIAFYLIILAESKYLHNEMRESTSKISGAIQESVSKVLADLKSNRDYMLILTEHLANIEGVMWVEVFDREPTVIAHTDKERIGGKPMETHESYVREVFENGMPIEEEDKQEGRYNRFVPVYDIRNNEGADIIGVVEIVMELNSNIEQRRKNILAISSVVNESVSNIIADLKSNRDYMQILTEHLGDIEGIKWIEVFDRESTIIAHTDKERVGGKPMEIHESYVHKVFENGVPIEEEDKQRNRYNRFVPVYDTTSNEGTDIIGVVEIVTDTKLVFERIASLRLKMILTVVALILMLFGLNLWLLRKIIVLPVRKLLDIIRNISKGELKQLVMVNSHDEFGRLANAFNKMADDLRISNNTLYESEEKYSSLIKNIPNVTWIANNKGESSFISPNIEKVYGYTPDEIYKSGESLWFGRIHPEDVETVKEAYSNLFKEEGSFDVEYRIKKKDGEWIWLYDKAVSTYEKEGELFAYGVFSDITERKLTEEHNKAILRTALDGFWIVDIQGRIMEVNDAYCNLTGYSRKELLKMCISDVEALENPEDTKKHIQQIIKAEGDRFESKHRCKDGRIIDIEVSTNYMNIKGGCFFSFIRDTTERKKIEEYLYSLSLSYRALFDNMLNGFAYCKIVVDENNKPIDFVYLEVNDAFERLTGLKEADIIGKKATEAIPAIKDKNPELFDIYEKVALTGEGTQFEIYFKPLEIWLSISVYSPKKGFFVAVFDNITERKKAEVLLQGQKRALEQKNIALSEILGQIEIEKKQIKDNVIANAESLLLPIIEKIGLKGESNKYAQLLRENLQELTSSFGTRLSEKKLKLTSREIDICNMVKSGLTSKEISSLLNISLQTIEKHRSHIRKKLGIVNEKLNLSSVLKTL